MPMPRSLASRSRGRPPRVTTTNSRPIRPPPAPPISRKKLSQPSNIAAASTAERGSAVAGVAAHDLAIVAELAGLGHLLAAVVAVEDGDGAIPGARAPELESQ